MSSKRIVQMNLGTPGARKERQAAALAKAPEMFKAFSETYQRTKSKVESIKAAEAICPSPIALAKVMYMLPRDLSRLIPAPLPSKS